METTLLDPRGNLLKPYLLSISIFIISRNIIIFLLNKNDRMIEFFFWIIILSDS